mmetsp:Transcript_31075/g.46328  ORF Transcript_31075/g.46328 Transcript_31075/m.46328 type:complete len:102 (-) Transcript_31075:572-877(-)
MKQNNQSNITTDKTYKCEIDITFPSSKIASQIRDVINVDDEIGDKVIRTLSVVSSSSNDTTGESNALRVNFQATEARLLRVSISTFYDVLNVSLKCFQEFS